MESVSIDLGLMVVLGLASSLHCVTMCGPLLAVAMAPAQGRWTALARWQMAYQLGRGAAYVALGALLGALGQAFAALFASHVVGGVVQIVVGGSLLAMAALWLWRGRGVGALPGGSRWSKLLARVLTWPNVMAPVLLGLLTGLLPCGVLWAALARAVAASSAWQGGALMLAFWAGSTPLLFGAGLASGALWRALGRRATVFVAVALVVMAGWLLAKGVRNLSGAAVAPPPCHQMSQIDSHQRWEEPC
jgi:hypothetical protein